MRLGAGASERDRAGLVRRVEQIAVGHVLHHVAERIAPVVVDLAAEDVAADAPVMRVAAAAQVLVAGHQVVEILHLERDVVQLDAAGADREERVVIHVLRAAVESHEGGEHRIALAEIDLVRVPEAEVRVVERLRLAEVLDEQDEMPVPLHAGRTALEVLAFAEAIARRAGVQSVRRGHRKRRERLDALHDLDADAIRIDESHPVAAARLAGRLHAGSARRPCDRLEIRATRRRERDAEKGRLPSSVTWR